jgi:hypothetical protein
MAIMLTPDQIPMFWEAIKFAAVNAEIVEEKYRAKFLNRLLYLLLSSKAQCFIRLSPERKLQMLGLTSIQVDPIRDEKTLFAYSLYSFEKVGNKVWIEDLKNLKDWAIASGCNSLTAWTNNEKALTLFNMLGWKKRFDLFILDISGGA